ncbi:MAG: hypothetical protein HW403_866 [Dehalococcoidia bacterium]|nr:hypothetical protein [Dehalococcoidia bacterium]
MRYTYTTRVLRLVALTLLALVMATSCARQQPTATSGISVPKTYTYEASDYSFSGPESIEGGVVTIGLKNMGKEPHHLQFFRINDTSKTDTIVTALKKEDLSVLAITTAPGGAGTVDPQGMAEVTMTMSEGQYLLACFVPGLDGQPHIAKGMLRTIRVDKPSGSVGTEPTAKVTVSLKDFTFDQPATLAAGKSVVKVVNAGPQLHEWNLLKLAPGKTVDDVGKFFSSPAGPPPFQSAGGFNGVQKDSAGYALLNLTPGQYVAICNIPDPSKDQPHSALGMVKQFSVQ